MSNETNSTDLSYEYVCSSGDNLDCPSDCVSLEACLDCDCAVAYVEDTGGPWGQVMDFLFCLLPIIYLVVVTIKPNPTPTTTSLPVSAVIMFLVRLMYLGSNPILTAGCVILGVHEAITPLTIMAGAIMLFETMEATKCLPYMMREMKALTAGHPVAECMLLFAFGYLVEGASGFGTPVALGAPMLVSTGHPALEAVVIMLLFNTFATVWGAVGTPLWFGFGGLDLSEDDFLEISTRAAIAMVFSSFLLIPMVLTVLVPFAVVRKNLVFLLLAIATVMGPVAGLATMTYEFPSLMGGLIGFGLTAVLIKFKVGLAPYDPEDVGHNSSSVGQTTSNNDNIDDAFPVGYISGDSSRRRNVSDLTEINVSAILKKSKTELPDASPEVPSTIPEEGATAPSTDEAVKEKDALVVDSKNSINGHWNVEVEADPEATSDAATTIVFVAPSTSSVEGKQTKEDERKVETKDDIKTDGKEATDLVLDPPLVEESGAILREQAEKEGEVRDVKASMMMSVADRTRQAEDELLGPRKTFAEGYLTETILRLFPIWAVVVTLILTRVSSIGIKQYLTKEEPSFDIQFGTYGEFRISVSLVLMLKDIMTYPGLKWKYELVYIPFLVPFVLISVLTMILYRKDMTRKPQEIVATVAGRLSSAAIALAGALTLVQLMIRFGEESPAYQLGTILSQWLKQGFVVICPLLGALGSFFSGSTTVSNLTFGEIQVIAAEEIGVSVNTMLALQSYGASAGNGICLNNIIAALTVVGLDVSEGEILKRTGKYVFASTTIATVVMLAFFFRF